MEELWAGAGQLPEQVSPDQRLGRSVHQGQGAHQQRDGHETLPILQGKPNGGPLTVEKFIFHLYFTCSSKLSKFWMKKNWIFNFKKWCYIFYVEYLIMITWFLHRSCGSASTCICYVFCSNLKRMLWLGKINWIASTPCLMSGLTYRGDGSTWRAYSPGAPTSRLCFLSRLLASRGKLLSIKWFIYDLILQIPIAGPLFLISFELMKSCLNLEWALSSWLWWRRWHGLLWWWTWSTSLTSRSSWSACLTSWGKSRKLLESIWREKEPRSQGTGTLCFIK